MKYRFVRYLNSTQALIQENDSSEYFVASYAWVSFTGSEVLVFPSDENGEITDWGEVDGGRGYSSLQEFLWEYVSR